MNNSSLAFRNGAIAAFTVFAFDLNKESTLSFSIILFCLSIGIAILSNSTPTK